MAIPIASRLRVSTVRLALATACVLLAAARVQAQETVEYYATDALGSIRVVFDQAGQVVGRSDYLPFGEALSPFGALPPVRFTGQQRDADESFDHFNARNLMRTGRFNRVDPIGGSPSAPQSWNRYAYVLGNPLAYVDPTGGLAQNPQSCWFGLASGCGDWAPVWDATIGYYDASGYGFGGWSNNYEMYDRGRRGTAPPPDSEQKRAPDIPKSPLPPVLEKPPVEDPPFDPPPCQANWTEGTPTVFVGGTINLTAIGGGELTTGLYFNLGLGTSRRAFGAFASAGGSVGLNLSGGITYGINKGDHSYFSGEAVEFSGGTEVSGTLLANSTGFAGFSLTAGPAYPLVVSASRTVTRLAQVYTGSAKECK